MSEEKQLLGRPIEESTLTPWRTQQVLTFWIRHYRIYLWPAPLTKFIVKLLDIFLEKDCEEFRFQFISKVTGKPMEYTFYESFHKDFYVCDMLAILANYLLTKNEITVILERAKEWHFSEKRKKEMIYE